MKKKLTAAALTLLAAVMLPALCACASPAPPAEDVPPGQKETPVKTLGQTADYEAVDWQVVSLNPDDYGIVYDIENMGTEGFPLAKLCVYGLYADGAFAESAHDELFRRFMEAPNTVLNFLALLGDQTARGGQTGELTAAEELCRAIAFANVFWYGDTEDFAAILEKYRAVYPEGRVAEIIDALQTELNNAADIRG